MNIKSYYRQGIGVWGTNSAIELVFNGKLELFNALANGLGNSGAGGNTPTHIVISPDAKINVTVDDMAAGIYHPGSGDLEIYGGEIAGPSAIEMKGGSLYIDGEEFKATASPTKQRAYSNGNSTSGYALAFVKNKAYNHCGNGVKRKDVTIKSGTFKGLIGKPDDGKATSDYGGLTAAQIDEKYGGGTYDPVLTITGGVFSKENADNPVVKNYIEKDYEYKPKTDDSGNYFVKPKSSPVNDVKVDSNGKLVVDFSNTTTKVSAKEIANLQTSDQKKDTTNYEVTSQYY